MDSTLLSVWQENVLLHSGIYYYGYCYLLYVINGSHYSPFYHFKNRGDMPVVEQLAETMLGRYPEC